MWPLQANSPSNKADHHCTALEQERKQREREQRERRDIHRREQQRDIHRHERECEHEEARAQKLREVADMQRAPFPCGCYSAGA